ncbi:MAG: sugar ABC transporter permease [Ruminococcus sp.]|nr:sugar ABC transporter permease [Ruminococcus sp.]
MKKKSISYAKWGYIFLLPFFITYCVFNLTPLVQTFYYSFLDYKKDTGSVSIFNTGSNIINNGFCGLDNFKTVLGEGGEFFKTLKNTTVIWLIGFIPQIVVSLLLAVWFTDLRLKIKAQGFFKTVIYLPNVIMASAIALLFYSLFTQGGALYTVFDKFTSDDISLLNKVGGARAIVGFINFMMWYGNTTILLMAAIMGIDPSLYESSQIDGATPSETFWKITIPLIKPLLSYVLITSMIGGIQMYDVPQLLAGDSGNPSGSLKTLVMVIQTGKDSNIGTTAAISVLIFIISAVLGLLAFNAMNDKPVNNKKKKKKKTYPAKGGK